MLSLLPLLFLFISWYLDSHPPSRSYHQMKCCGWTGPGNWSENILIKNSSQTLYACSCRNASVPGTDIEPVGLCEHLSAEPPIYEMVRNTKICNAVSALRLKINLKIIIVNLLTKPTVVQYQVSRLAWQTLFQQYMWINLCQRVILWLVVKSFQLAP